MERPQVEEFKRLCGEPANVWGMADSDVVALCDYILHLEAQIAAREPIVIPHVSTPELRAMLDDPLRYFPPAPLPVE